MTFNKDKFRKFLDTDKTEKKLNLSKKDEPKIAIIQEKEEVKLDLEELKEIEVVPEIVKIVEEVKEEIKEENVKEEVKLNEREEFEKLDLSKDELLELKKIAFVDILNEDLSISELVDLVLLAKSSKTVKAKNRDALVLREYVDVKGKITTRGKVYLEEESTKIRLRDLLQ